MEQETEKKEKCLSNWDSSWVALLRELVRKNLSRETNKQPHHQDTNQCFEIHQNINKLFGTVERTLAGVKIKWQNIQITW